MAVISQFIASVGRLSIFGDGLSNAIVASRDAAGRVLINGGAVATTGGTPTVANVSLIQIFGQDGDDTITADETNGALPAFNMFGGAGNDLMTGGSGADMLFGQDGNDTLSGKGGNDFLFGGAGNDVLIGGAGNDQVFGQAGDDRMIWNPGDGSDLFEGGDGLDTAEVNGGNGAETLTITANGSRVRLDRVDPAPFSLDIGTTENLVINANGGNDVITAGNGLASLIKLTIDGGAGDDSITGGDGNDVLLGGDGNDVVTGGRGADVSFLGAGDDAFVWNPGDGSDIVEGQSGVDTLQFNGANINERIDIAANGSRVRFTRDIANISMDLNGVEKLAFFARGGADNVTVHNLAGTGVSEVAVDLAGTPGGGVGDGAADAVVVEGRATADQISVTSSGATVVVSGLPGKTKIDGAESFDALVINTFGGDDAINASLLTAGAMRLTIDGGDGADVIVGSQGADLLIGGDGNDTINGLRGDDTALLGAGDDRFVWNPGDGNDIVEGQSGVDTLLLNGANIAETLDISANGSRARLSRDVGAVTMDLNEVERMRVATLGGADVVTVGDLTGAGVTQVTLDLANALGVSDGQADQVVVNATAGADNVVVSSSNGVVTVGGLAAQTIVQRADAFDSLVVKGQGGDDVINASTLQAGVLTLTVEAGDGNDLVVGSAGADTVFGGRGNDTGLLGAGDDTFIWNPGDGNDIVEGQGGFDTLLFNGANISENIDVSANGGRVRFTRDVANIIMDLNDVERISFAARGGADSIVVNDLTGTDMQQVAIDLGSDGQADTITVNGTAGADAIQIVNDNGVVKVIGLSARVEISNFEAGDRLVINALGGDDVVDATGFNAALQLTLNGGDGADTLLGGLGADILNGGAGANTLIGGGGADVFDNGTVVSGAFGSAISLFGGNTNLTMLTTTNPPAQVQTTDVLTLAARV